MEAHSCRTCGDLLVDGGNLCHLCSTRLGNPSHWSREEVVVAVRKWVRLEGGPPMQKDWRPVRLGGAKRWEAEFPDWPPSITGKVVFGGWNQMLEAAGIQAKPPRWTSEEIVAALRAYALEFGKAPAKRELIRPPTGYPLERTVGLHFGSFTAGLLAAGLKPRERAADGADR